MQDTSLCSDAVVVHTKTMSFRKTNVLALGLLICLVGGRSCAAEEDGLGFPPTPQDSIVEADLEFCRTLSSQAHPKVKRM